MDYKDNLKILAVMVAFKYALVYAEQCPLLIF